MTQPLPASTHLPFGFYERLIRKDEVSDIEALVNSNSVLISPPSKAQRREHLLDELTARLADILDNVSAQKNISESEQAELKVIGGLLREARKISADEGDCLPAEPLAVLRAIHAPEAPPTLPETGLRRPAIFTAARNDASLLNELRAELACTDCVDILVSFITWSGVRKILDILKSATALDANGNPRTRIRILTTTYIGATEARAVNALAQLPGVEVRISLDGRRNRLHAKAWMFHRLRNFSS